MTPPRLAVRMSYAGPSPWWARQVLAPVNTSSGPVTSRLCTSSKRTISTVRMCPSVTRPGDGSNDEYPTFYAITSGLG